MLWGTLVNCCGEIIFSNNKCSFNYREYISLKNNPSYVKNVVGLFGVCIYSIFFTTSLNASTFSWECKKNRSYLIKEREFIDSKDGLKKFPTKFLSNLNEKSKLISVTYDLGTGDAAINGNSGIVSGSSKTNDSLKKIGFQPILIFLTNNNLKDSEKQTNLLDKNGKKNLEKIEAFSEFSDASVNFILKTYYNTAKFISTELTEIQLSQYTLEGNDTLDIKELMKVSTGDCRLLNKED